MKPEDCPKLDECNKVKMILGKDLLDFPLRLFGQSVLIAQRSKRVHYPIMSLLAVLSLVLASTFVWGAGVGCSNQSIIDQSPVTIANILENPSKFEGKLVSIVGEYKGWQAENGYGPPVTRSDWIIKEDTSWIYVTGKIPDLDPIGDIGCPTQVKGIVRVTDEGIPYIEAIDINVEKK